MLCHVMSLNLCRSTRPVQLLVSLPQSNRTPLPLAPTIIAAAKNKKALNTGRRVMPPCVAEQLGVCILLCFLLCFIALFLPCYVFAKQLCKDWAGQIGRMVMPLCVA
jgi:hypothetical protein